MSRTPAVPSQPLAERMRPRSLGDMVGQRRLLAPGAALRRAIESGNAHSMILWGPPGCGKTTLASLMAQHVAADFQAISAVLSGLPEVRRILSKAEARHASGHRTVLFVDEVHRFNKIQQDAFLPYIERGAILFVGATTENPSFELNSALLSRCRVHVMDAVAADDIVQALQHALQDPTRGLGGRGLDFDDQALATIADAADGDVRRGLTLLEIASELAGPGGRVGDAELQQVLADRTRRFDKGGDNFHEQISALHKCVRGSNPDAALYWFARMLDGGCDPAYLARRLTRMAVEDIGLADPRALQMAIDAWDAFERLGAPEGELALAQVVIYLASTAKSNAAYLALRAARQDVEHYGSQGVPLHLRNASTGLARRLGYGRGYRYDHDVAGGVALEQTGFPEALGERTYYQPVEQGLEAKLKDKLDRLRAARVEAAAAQGGRKAP